MTWPHLNFAPFPKVIVPVVIEAKTVGKSIEKESVYYTKRLNV